jgi:hypothetical protein
MFGFKLACEPFEAEPNQAIFETLPPKAAEVLCALARSSEQTGGWKGS